MFGVFVNFFWVMDLLLELSMCVRFKLIYFAIGTLSVFMVEFVSLNFNFLCLWWSLFLLILNFLSFVAI